MTTMSKLTVNTPYNYKGVPPATPVNCNKNSFFDTENPARNTSQLAAFPLLTPVNMYDLEDDSNFKHFDRMYSNLFVENKHFVYGLNVGRCLCIHTYFRLIG